jgi:hypothetical protein
MRAKLTIAAAGLAITLAVAGAACGSSGNGTNTKAGKKRVPDLLNTIEEATEDIIDIVPGGRWDDIGKDARNIDTAWSGYKREAVADGARASLVARLDESLTDLLAGAEAEKGPETAQAANDVSAVAVELYGLYDVPRPVDIGRLDVVGRQIVLDVERGELGAAGAQVRKVTSIWDRGLRDDVLAHKGRVVADHTDATLDTMKRAVASGDGRTLVTQANVFLELVDDMERLY